jgi:LysM repeat protein
VPRDAQELFGPAWERPRRFEAYPSLRTRVGLPSFGRVPGLALAAIAIVIAAAFLFFVSPMILGLGKDHSGAGASASPSDVASAGPSDTPLPTAVPKPTPTTYTVVSGDTLSGIAQKFGVTTKALLKANPQIKNANSIKVGDVLNIPAPAGAAPSGAVGGASPSPIKGASAAP